jgi:hypothetical protein
MEKMQQSLLEGIDPEIMDEVVSRRDLFRRGASMSRMVAQGLALGSVPVALAALAKDAFGQAPSDLLDVLNFAFILENLENEFYKAVLGTSSLAAQNNAFATVRALIPASARESLGQIQKHEQQHVDFLKAAIPQFGGTPAAMTAADFDFTGGNGSGTGPFARATTELNFLLVATQAFEDTGVRAYKGQAGRLLINGNNNADIALEAALRIHSVEARHAAKIRRIRRGINPTDTTLRLSGYVRGGGVAAAGAGIYGGATSESNTSHVVFNGTSAVTIDAATLSNLDLIGDSTARTNAATQAFDEPLTKDEVIAIVRNFIKDDAARGLP